MEIIVKYVRIIKLVTNVWLTEWALYVGVRLDTSQYKHRQNVRNVPSDVKLVRNLVIIVLLVRISKSEVKVLNVNVRVDIMRETNIVICAILCVKHVIRLSHA